ncbi:hypothetical protein DTO013E5_398 [Penicillium roqueforti]|uniref:Ribonuclease H-like domain n=1 Tax=Penicillium roqueforti (strain FM164) TaxID=1365484 RepID=W6QMW1_PENRF|nr:uncharacterized protein LCP9604111_740 [Penicillium roqueforti]CDM30957.1 Ribonuclease H-like domain [Penicillium roqueforti FM164]KAF9253214.1 hypothetical protein LCP9604111_740 [Penicillium roqueforti]KAI1838730.1 hypothetical protein CBS147337_455 [Penicillium roqueforti]KAI2680378.1 hypothetical protein CBS147355_3358 [Penicillium roqueforti]KAI2706777.1 hypothetical protein CBS147372_688 [Penicillium roqueforti]
MPMRPNLLASRKTQSSIAKHSSHIDGSRSYGSLRLGLFERQHACARSVPRLRHVSLPNTSSSYAPPTASQSKRNFCNTTRKEGIWDDDDEVPEPKPVSKPVQRIPGRSAFVRPVQHRDLGSLIRSRAEGKSRVSQRLHIEKELNSLPSYQELVGSYIQLKYKRADDLLDESIKAILAYEAEYGALESTFQNRINDVVSRITKQVLHAEKTTQECATELESLSSTITARIVRMVSDNTNLVLQAEKITQKYVAEVIELSSSIMGLERLQAAVAEAEKTGRMIDHGFCCIVFGRTPEWESELAMSAQKIHSWQKCLQTSQKTLLAPLVHLSELSIHRLKNYLDKDFLRPRNTARKQIDRILHQSNLIQKNYVELRLKSDNTRIFPIRDLCSSLQARSNLRATDKWVFGQYKEILEHSYLEISKCAHHHRAYWLRRQMASHPLRHSELWNLRDFMTAVSSARSPEATDRRVLLALALGAPKDSPEARYLDESPLLISNKIYLEYNQLWRPKPPRSPKLHIYWRQLDVIAPLLMTEVVTWGIQNEVWYLYHSLRGDSGELWTRVSGQTRFSTVSKIADWCIEFQKHRSALRQMVSEYIHLNWLRLRSESLLRSMKQRVYLAGKFQVLNPLSQDTRAFKKWTDRMGQLACGAYIPLMASRLTRPEWELIHDEIERNIGVNSQILELGSSTMEARRREREESESAKAAFIELSQSRLERYIKGPSLSHIESPPTNQGNQTSGPVVIPKESSLKWRTQVRRGIEQEGAAESAADQGSQGESRLEHGVPPDLSTIKTEGQTTEDDLEYKPLPIDAPTGQDGQVIYKSSPKPRKRKFRSLDAHEFNPFLVNAPTDQDGQDGQDSQVIYKSSPKSRKRNFRSLDAHESNPFLVNAASSRVLPKPRPMPPKSKDVSLSTEPRLDDLRPPGPRETSTHFPGTRTRNRLRPMMFPKKTFAKPEPNDGRKYSTGAIFHQAQLRQSSGASDTSLVERPLETHLSSVRDPTNGSGSAEQNDSTAEPIPSSDIGSSASNLTTPQFWTHNSQQSPDGRKLIVHYCRTLQSTEEAVQHFLGSKVIGFDMEWKAQASGFDSIQSNVSVIQIANEERIAIFQVALFKPARSLEDLVSPSLRRLVESPDVIKVGVSIKADCTRLRKYLGIDAKATFELSHLYKLIKYGKDNPKLVNKRGVNLSEQVNEHFGLPLEKSDDVRCGDWTRNLSYRQVQYAATDPYACVRLFHIMEAKRQAMDPMPPRPAFAELNQPIVLPLGLAVNGEEDPLI